MQKLINYIKNGKSTGALWIFLLGAIVAFSTAYDAHYYLPLGIPHVQKFTDTFFPIQISNGQVVTPKNAIIEKTYQIAGEPIVFKLNTTTDMLSEGETQNGLYLTRSYLYSVTNKDIRRQKLQHNLTLDRIDYTPFLEALVKKIVWAIVIACPFFNFLCFLIAVVFYAFICEFAAALNKVVLPFKQRMRLNTVLFIALYALSSLLGYVGFPLSAVSFFLIMLALQIISVKQIAA